MHQKFELLHMKPTSSVQQFQPDNFRIIVQIYSKDKFYYYPLHVGVLRHPVRVFHRLAVHYPLLKIYNN